MDIRRRSRGDGARQRGLRFNRIAMWEQDLIPAVTSDQLAELADIAVALPQVCSQPTGTLEQSPASQELSMDSMPDEADPTLAICVARLHLGVARGLSSDPHKHLMAAYNATPRIFSYGVEDARESTA